MTPMADWEELSNYFGRNRMREPGVEPGCLAAPDPKTSTPPEQDPNNGLVARTTPHDSAPLRAGHVTARVTEPEPELIAARLVRGPALRHCVECGRAISSAWPLRLTYRQGRSVFVSWVHPHVAVDEGQLPCAPDVELVKAAIR